MMVRWSGKRQVNVKCQSELDIGGRETFLTFVDIFVYLFHKDLLSLENGTAGGIQKVLVKHNLDSLNLFITCHSHILLLNLVLVLIVFDTTDPQSQMKQDKGCAHISHLSASPEPCLQSSEPRACVGSGAAPRPSPH